jgi:hypothetical protein
MPRAFPTAVIEKIDPLIDGGRYPVKRVVGEDLVVTADIHHHPNPSPPPNP